VQDIQPARSSQNCWASCWSRCTYSTASRRGWPGRPAQARSSDVFPLPAGAETTVTFRAAARSRAARRSLRSISQGVARATRQAYVLSTTPRNPVNHRDQVTPVSARDHGLPRPAAAFVMSPYADLTLAGETMDTKREADPLLSRDNLQARVPDYTAGQDAAVGLISPVFADLSGLPPLIIQAGTHEVLLDDAVRLARQAAIADVEVTLDVTPRVPHVFQAYYPILDEAAAALDRAGQLLSAHMASAERVTA
jgi:hypothetical protein